jgi:crotonobetainyl-CoA:carnitine CoA-transferase CaiB-like acyl-CoA transferase
VDDVQFKDRFKIFPHEKHGADMLPFPVKFVDEELPAPTKAPEVGEHSAQVLADVLGYDAAKVDELKEKGAFGS